MTKIRLVLFDAFSTLLVPRLPVYVQYSQTFEPYLGTLEPNVIKSSFKSGACIRPHSLPTNSGNRYLKQVVFCYVALKELQTDKPAYQSGADAWWSEVIRRTAIGAGADPNGMSAEHASRSIRS